jgi:hypothetical protein
MTNKMVGVRQRIWDDLGEGKITDILSKYETLLAEALEAGADEGSVRVELSVEYEWGEKEYVPHLIYNRPETEKERGIREEREARQRARSKAQREKEKLKKEERERKELERLMKKYKEDNKSGR